MPQIPLYESNVSASADIGAVEASPGAAAAPWQALGAVGQGVSKIAAVGHEYSERKKELRKKSERDDYDVRLEQFKTQLIEERNNALMRGDATYTDVYDKVVAPRLQQFEAKMGERGYSAETMSEVGALWDLDREGIVRGEVAEREKMELADLAMRREQKAAMLLSQGDIEGADAIYSELSGIMGEAKAADMKSSALMGLRRIEMQGFERDFIETGNVDAYLERLESIDTEGMQANHATSINIEKNAKRNNARGRVVRRMTATTDDVFKKIAEDDLEGADLATLYNDNPLMGEALDTSLKAQLAEGVAAGDKDAIKAQEALDEMVSGEESWGGAVRRIGNLRSSYGEVALWLSNEYAKDIVTTQDNLSAFESLWGRHFDYKVSVDSDTRDYVHTMSYYMKRKSEGQGDYLSTRLRALKKWRENPGDKTYEEFKTEQFGKDAKSEVQSVAAPQFAPALEAGYTEDGYEFMGGDPGNPESWRKL